MIFQRIIAIIGLVFIVFGNFLISSKLSIRRRYTYPLLIIGGICLLYYSVYLKDKIFIILQSILIITSIIGLIRINKKHLKKEINKIKGKK